MSKIKKPVLAKITDSEIDQLIEACQKAKSLMKIFSRDLQRVEIAAGHSMTNPDTKKEFKRLDKINSKIYRALGNDFSI